jgi:hypothetical protein
MSSPVCSTGEERGSFFASPQNGKVEGGQVRSVNSLTYPIAKATGPFPLPQKMRARTFYLSPKCIPERLGLGEEAFGLGRIVASFFVELGQDFFLAAAEVHRGFDAYLNIHIARLR